MAYNEVKEDVYEGYDRLHIRAKFTLRQCFSAFLTDYIIHDDYDLSEVICIYTSFILMLIEKDEDFSFLIEPLKEKLEKITDEQLQKEIEDPNDIKLLKEDLEKLKPYLQ